MVTFSPLKSPSSFRKLAAAMWKPPNDPHIFGFVDLDVSAVRDLQKRYNSAFNCKITITHMVMRMLALTFVRFPKVNCKIGWGSILQRSSIDIFCQVATDGGRDLSGVKVPEVDKLDLQGIAAKLNKSAGAIREDKDPDFKRSRDLFKALPLWALRIVLKLISLATNSLNLHLPSLGLPRDPFGSAMVTNVGMLGIDSGFAPFTPLARCPAILTVTRIKDRPWVDDGQLVVRPVLRLCGTFDHRLIDGYHAGEIVGAMEAFFAEPELMLSEQERKALAE